MLDIMVSTLAQTKHKEASGKVECVDDQSQTHHWFFKNLRRSCRASAASSGRASAKPNSFVTTPADASKLPPIMGAYNISRVSARTGP